MNAETDLVDWGFFVVLDDEVLSQTSKKKEYSWIEVEMDDLEAFCWEAIFETVLWARFYVMKN